MPVRTPTRRSFLKNTTMLFPLEPVEFCMPDRASVLLRVLQSPSRILLTILIVVFGVEVVVMLLLPHIVWDSIAETQRAVLDALLLTLLCSPVLWAIIIAPLRRIAIQEHERSETIVANAGEGILTINQQWTVTSANRAALQLFALRPEQAIGHTIARSIPELQNAIESSQYQIRTEGVRRDGSRFPLLCTVSRYSANRGGSYIVILRDLTETYRREEEQITAAREREALRGQQMAMLAQLATGVAHEIRNPLTSIKMLIQVNRAMFADKGLPTEDLDLVEQEIRRMERSVNGLLDYGRPTKGETKLFTLQDAVDRTLRLIEGRCEKQGIEVTLDFPTDPLQVMGDPSEIRQLLLNLVLNALDAMPDGGTLSLKARPDNEVINISVADTGPGIDHDVMEQLFSPFVTSKPNGTGLGLCICRRIAESHHGSLTAHNLSEQGACLELILPNPATTNKTNHADANTSGH